MLVCWLHTTVCTICIRCCLSLLTIPAMSTTPSFLACSRARSMVMKVPVRPTPALQCTRIGESPLLHPAITFLWSIMSGVPYSGTPWSGQEVKWYWVMVILDWPFSSYKKIRVITLLVVFFCQYLHKPSVCVLWSQEGLHLWVQRHWKVQMIVTPVPFGASIVHTCPSLPPLHW